MKMSILFLYIRIFPSERFNLLSKIVLVFTACYGIAFMLATIFLCTPVSHIWNGWDGEHTGKCNSSPSVVWAHAIINIVLDLVIIGSPVPILLKLTLAMDKKIGILAMFGIGIVYADWLKPS